MVALNQTREMSRGGEEQQIKAERKKRGCDKRLKRKEEMREGSGGKRQREKGKERCREAHWGDTESKDEEFRMKRGGGLKEEAQANPDRLLLSLHCHYFVIMVVGASLHVLLITDKGLGDVRANTKTELKQGQGNFCSLWEGEQQTRISYPFLFAAYCSELSQKV